MSVMNSGLHSIISSARKDGALSAALGVPNR
jgi:hypothetical protein